MGEWTDGWMGGWINGWVGNRDWVLYSKVSSCILFFYIVSSSHSMLYVYFTREGISIVLSVK